MEKAINTAMELSMQFGDGDNILSSMMVLAKHDTEACRRWALSNLGDTAQTRSVLNWVAHRTGTAKAMTDHNPTFTLKSQGLVRHTRHA